MFEQKKELSGHWTSNHKSKSQHKDSCGSCGHHDSDCKCNSKPVRQHKTAPLSDCVLVDSVVCSKKVQKVAELAIPLSEFFTGLTIVDPVLLAARITGILAAIATVTIVPNFNAIVINRRVIRDKVVNIGFVPATVTIALLPGATLPDGVLLTIPTITVNLPFQAHTDCPGACPEDTVIETPFVLEGTFSQLGVSLVGFGGLLSRGILAKAIFRTTLTVTRQVIVDGHDNVCDVENRCETPTAAPNFTLPSTPPGS